MAKATYEFLTPGQINALQKFANANGAQWKSKLNYCWSTGRYREYPGTESYGELQQVRNIFGPGWLIKYSFTNPKTHKVRRYPVNG